MLKYRDSSKRHGILTALDSYKNLEEKIIKKTRIRDLLKNPEYHKISMETCNKQLPYFSKKDSSKICNCLNEKNGHMTVEELEYATKNMKETPGSICVTLFDKIKKTTLSRKKKRTLSKKHTKSKSKTKKV